MNELTPSLPPSVSPATLERVLLAGDLSALTEAQRVEYYRAVCASLGLNPLTQPFQYLRLNGRLVLYATRAATDQLRSLHGISIVEVRIERTDDLITVTVRGRARDGREDCEIGVVNVRGLQGDALANAEMKALTKAKRRLTLSLAGLGWLDESEIETIPGAQAVSSPDEELVAAREALRVFAQSLADDDPRKVEARRLWREGTANEIETWLKEMSNE